MLSTLNHVILLYVITIKSKETSSKLASYPAMKSLATNLSTSCTGYYNLHWLLFASAHTNLQDLIPTLAA